MLYKNCLVFCDSNTRIQHSKSIFIFTADAIKFFFTKLEAEHGVTLISHLLAYVTASKYGLTEPEILDILALDTEVL